MRVRFYNLVYSVARRSGEKANMDTGMLSAFMAFIEQGDEVIIFEPFFDQSVFAIHSCMYYSSRVFCLC